MIATAYSQAPSVNGAVSEIKAKLATEPPALVLFFASTVFPPQEIAQAMHEGFPGSCVMGCTSAGEIASGKMLTNSLVVMTFGRDMLSDVAVEVVENPADREQVKKAFASFERFYETDAVALDFEKHVGLVLCDGLSRAEEKLMEALGDITNVTFVGGSAGDDFKYQRTSVFAHGREYSNAAVLALLKPLVPYRILKTQSFRCLDRELTPTRVNQDPRARQVFEFGGQPAVEAYAQALGTSVADISKHFIRNPLGLLIDGEIFVRSLHKTVDESLTFHCRVSEGLKLWLLEGTDIVEETRQQLSAKMKELGEVSAIINFNCIQRTFELEQKSQLEEYGRLFEGLPAIGFNTYGEAYLGHMNQTATMLLLGTA